MRKPAPGGGAQALVWRCTFLQDGGVASEAVWPRVAKQYFLDKSLGARQETAVSYLFVSISVGRYFHKSLPFLEAGISYSVMVLASMLART